jgi:hypothetical protein
MKIPINLKKQDKIQIKILLTVFAEQYKLLSILITFRFLKTTACILFRTSPL